jgi:diguanylate cyclase (GGDEF)-like protein
MGSARPMNESQGSTSDVFARFLRLRTVAIAVSGLLAAFLPAIGSAGPWAGLLCFVVMIPYNEMLVSFARRRRRLPWFVGLIDLTAVLVAAVLEPTLLVGGAMLILANLSLPAATLPRRAAALLGFGAVGGVALAAMRVSGDYPIEQVTGFATAAPVLVSVVAALARREAAESTKKADLLATTAAIAWEFDLRAQRLTKLTGPIKERVGVTAAAVLADPSIVAELVHPDDLADLTGDGFMRKMRHKELIEVRLRRRIDSGVDVVGPVSWWRMGGMRTDGNGLMSGVLVDTTDLHSAEEAMRELSLTDQLTGLPNRASVRATVASMCDSSHDCALLLIDIDRFKEVNDALGHHVGDQLLIGIAQRLREVEGLAACGRLGGDEFAAVLIGPNAVDAATVATRVLASLTQPFETNGLSLVVGASVGVARRSPTCTTIDSLFRASDAAMYHAKRSGGGVVEHSETTGRDSARSMQLLSDLHRRLTVDGLDVAVQPLVSAASGEIVGVEALARWHHSQLGWIPPSEFIPLAEMSGQIHRVAVSILRQSIRAAARWRDLGFPIAVSVNLSAANLLSHEVVEIIETLPAEVGLPWADIVLEITESQVMEQLDLVDHVLERFSKLGLTLSIDDFGTGHSSLGRLQRLPFGELKIDRSFISGSDGDCLDPAIFGAIVAVGHASNMAVVAEGLETPEQIAQARRLGCDLLQGYGLFRPMTLEAFDALLETSGTSCVIPAVDVDHLAGGGGEPVAQQRDAGLGDSSRVVDIPAEGRPAVPHVFEDGEAGDALRSDGANGSGGDQVGADSLGAQRLREIPVDALKG